MLEVTLVPELPVFRVVVFAETVWHIVQASAFIPDLRGLSAIWVMLEVFPTEACPLRILNLPFKH